ncbi:hypothetical protein EDB84DRAFT_435460 [Lactarius hengduanensis]|nr:hypothetical protein EDB84DRAFT_435460 [Lactarius hengduanensis]
MLRNTIFSTNLVGGELGSRSSTLLKTLTNQHAEYHLVEDDTHFPTLTVDEIIRFPRARPFFTASCTLPCTPSTRRLSQQGAWLHGMDGHMRYSRSTSDRLCVVSLPYQAENDASIGQTHSDRRCAADRC